MKNMNDKLVGRNPVLEALKSGADIEKIFVKKDAEYYESKGYINRSR